MLKKGRREEGKKKEEEGRRKEEEKQRYRIYISLEHLLGMELP